MTTPGPAPRILVIEDEQDLAGLVEYNLRAAGFTPEVANTGAAGVAKARAQRPDLVLLDLMLPDVDGLDILRQLREDLATAEVPVIVLTAREDPELRLKCLGSGADDFLSKGAPHEELRSRIRTITRLNRYRTLRRERQKARDLLQNTPDGILLLDLKGAILEISEPACRLLGVGKATDVLNRPISEILPSSDRGPLKMLLQSLGNDGQAADAFEQTFNLGQGKRLTLRIHYRKLAWEDREAILLFLMDSSGLKAAQENLQRQRQTWRLIGRDAGLGVVECEWRQRTLRVSDSWRDMFFYDPLSAPRDFDAYLELVHPEDRESFSKAVETNVARSTERFNLTCRLLDGAGRYRIVDASFWVIPDIAGGAQRLIAWQRETADKMAEELVPPESLTVVGGGSKKGEESSSSAAPLPKQIHADGQMLSPGDFAPVESVEGLPESEAVIRLKRYLRARDNLLVNLGHELDTQLNALLGLSQLLLEGTLGPITARQNQCLRKIERQLRHLADLNSDIEGVMNLETSESLNSND